MQDGELNDLERKLAQVQADKIADKLEQNIKQSDSIFTKTGKIVNPREAHPFEIGAALMLFGYLLHMAFIAVYLGILVKSLVDVHIRQKEVKGWMAQVAHEVHYYLTGAALTAATLEGLGYAAPDVEIATFEIISFILGA